MKKFLILTLFFTMCSLAASVLEYSSPEVIRERINSLIENLEAPKTAVDSVEDKLVEVGERITPIRIYQSGREDDDAVILLIHGGAFVAGSLDTHDLLARYLTAQTQARVISVGYETAPEAKFPVALKQCFDVLLWIQSHLVDPPQKIAVVGDSSGGNLAAGLCLLSRDRAGPPICLQVLINPALDLTCRGTLVHQGEINGILCVGKRLTT